MWIADCVNVRTSDRTWFEVNCIPPHQGWIVQAVRFQPVFKGGFA